MPEPVAQAVEPATIRQGTDLIVLIEVGYVADLRNFQSSAPGPSGGAADLQRAETGGEVAQLQVGQMLVAENQYGMGVDGRLDRLYFLGLQWLREIQEIGLGGEARMQHQRLHSHGFSAPPSNDPACIKAAASEPGHQGAILRRLRPRCKRVSG